MPKSNHQGSCLCGKVTFTVNGQLWPIIYCHCTQCRKQTGHFLAATACATSDLTIRDQQSLAWYRASDQASRGFCANCGSTLFWKPDHGRHVSIAAGAIDGPTELVSEGHIFCADKGDYYEIPLDQGYVRQSV